MYIKYEKERFSEFHNMIQKHNFKEHLGLTSKYKAFEIPNLTKDMTLEMLRKLNPSTTQSIPSYPIFWKWYKKVLGEQTVDIFVKHLWPNQCKDFDKLKREMMSNEKHEFWQHISARVYKKWCSIVTESQCLYSIVENVKRNNKDWKLITSPELDVTGVDFVILHSSYATPIQVKKDSRSKIAHGKSNSSENFSRGTLGKYATDAMDRVISDLNLVAEVTPSVLIKYDTKKNGEFPYPYLKEYENGFIYFDGSLLVEQLSSNIKELKPKKIKIR